MRERKNAELLCRELMLSRRMFATRGLIPHLWEALLATSLYSRWQRYLRYFRRFRFIAAVLRAAGWLLAVAETGALVLLGTAVLLILLPPLLLLSVVTLLASLVEAPRQNRRFAALTAQKHVYVLFAHPNAGSFFAATAHALAARKNSFVIVVSPFWLSARSVRRGRFFCTAREEAPNLFTARRYYFFSLRHKVLDKRDVAYVY